MNKQLLSGGSSKKDIQDRMLDAAQARAAEEEMPFAQNCDAELREKIRDGAKKARAARLASDESRIELAESHIRALVGRMAREARRRGDHEMQERSLRAALRALCPLWPIC